MRVARRRDIFVCSQKNAMHISLIEIVEGERSEKEEEEEKDSPYRTAGHLMEYCRQYFEHEFGPGSRFAPIGEYRREYYDSGKYCHNGVE